MNEINNISQFFAIKLHKLQNRFLNVDGFFWRMHWSSVFYETGYYVVSLKCIYSCLN
jgi:hypothetical protein